MESITIYIKEKEQVNLLSQLLKHLDFVIMPNEKIKTVAKKKEHSIFSSAGMWAGRNISQEELRAKAWKRN